MLMIAYEKWKEAPMATVVVISTLSLAAFAFSLTVFASVRVVRNYLVAHGKHVTHLP